MSLIKNKEPARRTRGSGGGCCEKKKKETTNTQNNTQQNTSKNKKEKEKRMYPKRISGNQLPCSSCLVMRYRQLDMPLCTASRLLAVSKTHIRAHETAT